MTVENLKNWCQLQIDMGHKDYTVNVMIESEGVQREFPANDFASNAATKTVIIMHEPFNKEDLTPPSGA